MAAKVSYLPKDYNSVTPYLIVRDAAKAIDYYKKVFGATETVRMPGPDGKIGHAELKIGNSHIMLADENPSMGAGHISAATVGGSPVKAAQETLRILRDQLRSVIEFGGLTLESYIDFQSNVRGRINRLEAGPPPLRAHARPTAPAPDS